MYTNSSFLDARLSHTARTRPLGRVKVFTRPSSFFKKEKEKDLFFFFFLYRTGHLISGNWFKIHSRTNPCGRFRVFRPAFEREYRTPDTIGNTCLFAAFPGLWCVFPHSMIIGRSFFKKKMKNQTLNPKPLAHCF